MILSGYLFLLLCLFITVIISSPTSSTNTTSKTNAWDYDQQQYVNHNSYFAGLDAAFPENPGYGQTVWYAIHGSAIFTIFLSCCGSSYIIVLSCIQASMSPLRTIQYFPLCISICDLWFGIFHGLDHLISVTGRKVMDGNMCVIFGFSTVWAMNVPTFWVTATAIYIYFIICRSKKLYFGKGDWVLHCVCWGVPFLIGLIPLGLGKYGPELMWCGIPDGIFYYNGIIVIIGLCIVFVFYGLTFFKIRKVLTEKKEIQKIQLAHGNTVKSTDIDKHLQESARQMPIFVLIYIIQWVPYVTYAILLYNDKNYWQFDNLVVILTNAGGIMNAVAYRRILLARKNDAALSHTNTFMEKKINSLGHSNSRSGFSNSKNECVPNVPNVPNVPSLSGSANGRSTTNMTVDNKYTI